MIFEGTKGLSELTECQPLMGFSFPAIDHPLANFFGGKFRFLHSVAILKAIDERIVKLKTGALRHFGQRKYFP